MTKQLFLFTSAVIAFFIFSNSFPAGDDNEGMGPFSSRKGQVAFTHYKNKSGAIYFTKHIDSVARRLTSPKRGWDHTFDLSQDLSKILYINYPNYDYEVCHMCLLDIRSGKTDTLLKNAKFVTDACLSDDRKLVWFLMADEKKNTTPAAKKAPHHFEIWQLDIRSRESRKLTDLRAYGMQGLIPTYSDTLLCANMFADQSGMVLVSVNNGRIRPVNFSSPRNGAKQSFLPVELRADSILYTASNELYRHNLKTDKSKFILRCPENLPFSNVQPDSAWKNLLFSAGGKMYTYSVPDKKLQQVEIRLK